MRAVLLLAVVVTVAPGAALADFSGRVVKVTDGDTITVLVNKKQIRVRLDGIDAPERGQAFRKRSQQSLAQAVRGEREQRRQLEREDLSPRRASWPLLHATARGRALLAPPGRRVAPARSYGARPVTAACFGTRFILPTPALRESSTWR